MKPTAIISTPPTNVTIEIADWDKILVQWSPPVNDGGQGISEFLVEWWSNYNNNYGTNEIQTILMNADVDGGTWLLTSPAGYQYPFPLPWDIEYDELEAAERMTDVDTLANTTARRRGAEEYRIAGAPYRITCRTLNVTYQWISGLSASTERVDEKKIPRTNTLTTVTALIASVSCEQNRSGNATLVTGGSSLEPSLTWVGKYSYVFSTSIRTPFDGFGVRASVKNPSRGFITRTPPQAQGRTRSA